MSHIQNTINALENQADETQKAIQVLNAVEGKHSFIVVTVTNGSVNATASKGLDLKSAVTMLTAAARSYTESLDNADLLDEVYKLMRKEIEPVNQRAVAIAAAEEEDANEDNYPVEPEVLRPTRKRKPTPGENI